MADKYILVGRVNQVNTILHDTWQSGDRLLTPDGNEIITADNLIHFRRTLIEFNNERKKTLTVDFDSKTPTIAYIMLYANPSLGGSPLAAYVNLAFHFDDDYRLSKSIVNIRSKLIRTYLSQSVSAGATSIKVDDNSDFRSNDLILISNSEQARVESARWWERNINLQESLLNNHNNNANVVRVIEFGGFTYFNMLNNNTGYISVSFDANITETVYFHIYYRL